jgi:hypothetical protein
MNLWAAQILQYKRQGPVRYRHQVVQLMYPNPDNGAVMHGPRTATPKECRRFCTIPFSQYSIKVRRELTILPLLTALN